MSLATPLTDSPHIAIPIQPPNHPLITLPEIPSSLVLQYLATGRDLQRDDNLAIVNIRNTCRALRNDTLFRNRGVQALTVLNREAAFYPEELQRLFLTHGIPILRLPFLNFARNFISSARPEALTAPIMRFRDGLDRIGVAFHVINHQARNRHGFVFSVSRSRPDYPMTILMSIVTSL